MSLIEAVRGGRSSQVLESLKTVAAQQEGLAPLAARLGDLADLVRWDMKDVEELLATLPRGTSHVHQSAHHLLDRGGKRLRPMCTALASRVGTGFSGAARDLAVSVELVHCATLLHDDVVDLGDQRRGAPSARTIYGNAASIFAGDWLLIDALRRVRGARVDGVLERLFDIIEEMIFAESVQLENRGRLDSSEDDYWFVVEGKTAALFRWAMFAGARAGGLSAGDAEGDRGPAGALEDYGRHLGVAFQLVDDLLDFAGDEAKTGKALFTDLREGKMTYPLLVARDRDDTVLPLLETMLDGPEGEAPPAALQQKLREALERTSALADCRALAQNHADQAVTALSGLPASRAKDALLTVAEATVHRER